MHYSGILVSCRPPSIYDCVRELSQLRNVDVYSTDPATGRIVIVLETESVQEQESGLRHVQALDHVIAAELVYHYFGDESVAEDNEPVRSAP